MRAVCAVVVGLFLCGLGAAGCGGEVPVDGPGTRQAAKTAPAPVLLYSYDGQVVTAHVANPTKYIPTAVIVADDQPQRACRAWAEVETGEQTYVYPYWTTTGDAGPAFYAFTSAAYLLTPAQLAQLPSYNGVSDGIPYTAYIDMLFARLRDGQPELLLNSHNDLRYGGFLLPEDTEVANGRYPGLLVRVFVRAECLALLSSVATAEPRTR